MRLQLPFHVTVEELRKKQRVGVPFVDRAAQNRPDPLEDGVVFVLRGAAPFDYVPAQTVSDVALDGVHQRLDADVAHCRFAVKVPSPSPTSSTLPFMASLLSTVPV